jgi:hypothetical protein
MSAAGRGIERGKIQVILTEAAGPIGEEVDARSTGAPRRARRILYALVESRMQRSMRYSGTRQRRTSAGGASVSFHFNLYRAPLDAPPLPKWDRNLAEPIGGRSEVWQRLMELLPTVQRESEEGANVSGSGVDCVYKSRYAISTAELEAGGVYLIRTDNHSSPTTIRAIMDRFDLNRCCTDFGDFREPHACDDEWNLVKKPR